MNKDLNEKTFSELLNDLQNIVTSLESNKLSLEESVEAYQKGMELSVECKKRLEAAKAVVVKKVTTEGEENF